ncbi:MAG: hypothetical protein LM567_00525 [Desulfurococcaceae archaeon]|jgi:predicted RNA-binding protein with EMAP domain|nr:hypothetical protein [Desulfurococcaceae archaeon]
MSVHEAFQSLKDLIERFENLLEEGKIATISNDVKLVIGFINSVESSISLTINVLEKSNNILQEIQQDDKLFKYISTYHRMLILVSIPYLTSILETAASILKNKDLINEANRAITLAEKLKYFVDTLRRQSTRL